MERLRRGAEGVRRDLGARRGPRHTLHEATDLPASLTLPTIKRRKVDGPSLTFIHRSTTRGADCGDAG